MEVVAVFTQRQDTLQPPVVQDRGDVLQQHMLKTKAITDYILGRGGGASGEVLGLPPGIFIPLLIFVNPAGHLDAKA